MTAGLSGDSDLPPTFTSGGNDLILSGKVSYPANFSCPLTAAHYLGPASAPPVCCGGLWFWWCGRRHQGKDDVYTSQKPEASRINALQTAVAAAACGRSLRPQSETPHSSSSGTPPSNEVPAGPYPFLVESEDGRQVPVVQAYAYGKYLGYLTVTFDPEGNVLGSSGNPILLDSSIPQGRPGGPGGPGGPRGAPV